MNNLEIGMCSGFFINFESLIMRRLRVPIKLNLPFYVIVRVFVDLRVVQGHDFVLDNLQI